MINILFLTLNSRIGGTERMVLSLAGGLDKNIYDCRICASVGDGTLIREAEAAGIKAFDLKMKGPLDFTVIFKLRAIIKKHNIQILHTFLYHTNILGRILGRILKVPVIISTQRSTDDWRKFYHIFFDKLTADMASLIISNSRAGKKRLVEIEGIDAKKIAVIHNGVEVDAAAVRLRGEALRKALGFGDGVKIIGTVANLKSSKGLEYLIKAMPAVIKAYPGARAVIVGYGPMQKQLECLASSTGAGDKIIFTGFKSDSLAYISLCDIFALPSLWEGMPVALMEAMALGKPVAASNVGGVSELVTHNTDGILVKPGSTAEISQAIINLFAHPETAVKMGENARQTIEKRFSRKRMVRETEEVYQSLLGSTQL